MSSALTSSWVSERPQTTQYRQSPSGRLSVRVIGDQTAETGTPRWLKPLVLSVDQLLRLPQGWDSYDARPINPQSIISAVHFLQQLLQDDAQLPELVPTVRGFVQVEWHTSDVDFEVEVGPQGPLFAYFCNRRTGAEWESEVTANLGRIAEVITKLRSAR